MEMPYSWNLYLINSVEDIVIFLGFKVFNSDNSCNRNVQVIFLEKPRFKIDI